MGARRISRRNSRRRGDPIAERFGKKLRICFCLREYEAWFLANLADLRNALPEYNIDPDAAFPNAREVRGAKEALKKACRAKGYRPARDQNLFSKRINVQNLMRDCRSFRKFVKEASGKSYDDLLRIAVNANEL